MDEIEVDTIREQTEYGGFRIKTNAAIGGARVRVLIDVGFGDAIEPGLRETELPVLLGLPALRLRSYTMETVIAEKFQAMVVLGRANTRMKDVFDVWMLSRAYTFEGQALARAIHATFSRHHTAIPTEVPDALSPAFASDPAKQRLWASFIANIDTRTPPLATVLANLADMLMLHARAAVEAGGR